MFDQVSASLDRYDEDDPDLPCRDDTFIPRIVSLTTQATGLKFLMLHVYGLTLPQHQEFRQMLKQRGKWTIQTLTIRSSLKTTLACLRKCDPMHLTGVEFDCEDPEVGASSACFAKFNMGVRTREYDALKAFYKTRDDSRNQSTLLKRLSIRYRSADEHIQTSRMIKITFDKVAFITKDFPNLEWLILNEEDIFEPIRDSTEHNLLPAWVSAPNTCSTWIIHSET
jgi:hypothetical protein